MKFIVEEAFLEIFPQAKIGLIVGRGLDNSSGDDSMYQSLLDESLIKAEKHIREEEWIANPVVANWRRAYQQFKTKKGARSSIEALLKRVQTGKGVGSISPLVDVYNSISLEFGVPCGGEDIDVMEGDVRLGLAEGDEEFITYGSDKSEPPYPGEVVYKDDAGAICRCWNWREAVRTMLTEETKNAIFVIESIDGTDENFETALYALEGRLKDYIGGDYSSAILDAKNPVLEF